MEKLIRLEVEKISNFVEYYSRYAHSKLYSIWYQMPSFILKKMVKRRIAITLRYPKFKKNIIHRK